MEYTTGKIVKLLRKKENISQEELGVILGVKRGTIQKYENNSITLNIETIRKLCIYFRVPSTVFVFPENVDIEVLFRVMYEEKDVKLLYTINAEGRRKVIDYINDLCLIDKYRTDVQY